MNLNDKNIDQIFRDAAQNSDAPRYDRSYWKEVNSILDSEDRRKRGFVLWSVAGSIVAALLVSTLFIVNEKESNLLMADNNQTSLHTSHDYHETEISESKVVSNQKIVGQNISDVTNKTEGINGKPTPENNNEIKAERFSNSAKSDGSLNAVNSDKVTSNEKSLNKSDIPNSIENNLNENNISSNTNNSIETSPGLNEGRLVESLSPRAINFEQAPISKELVPFKLPKNKPINFYAKMSAGLMENYETSRPFQSGVFDLSINVEYNKEQVLFRTGLGFQATSNADLVVSERAKVYGFGLTTHQNNLSYQSLYDIYLPIELGYALKNTSFGVGTQVNYMLTTTMNYETLENNIIVNEAKLNGFQEGLNALTAQGYIWLEQKLTDRFVAGMKVGTNLNSRIKEGRYFNESATTNPLYGQITLRYNLSK